MFHSEFQVCTEQIFRLLVRSHDSDARHRPVSVPDMHKIIFLSALLPLKGNRTEKFGRRGRPWPREREGPATESWEGFTGPNFYGLVIQGVFLRIII